MLSLSSAAIAPRTRRSQSLVAGLLLALAVVIWLAAPAQAATHQVMIRQYAYGPASMSIAQGDTVTWTNMDSVGHDVVVTSGPASFRSPMLAKGKNWSFTFAKSGSYSYICSVHPDMKASIAVAAAPKVATKAPAAVAPSVAPTRAPTQTTTAPQATPKASVPAQPTAAAPAQDSAYVATAAPAAGTLNPLLFVLGLAAAVVVFCLLLMTSRPVARPERGELE